MNRMLVSLLTVILSLSIAEAALSEVVFTMTDPMGDDTGSGQLVYPSHEVFQPGLFDLLRFTVSRIDKEVCFDLKFRTVTNPFYAPEGYFHQRIEVYIDTTPNSGSERITVGGWEFDLSPEYGWEIRLSGAPFGETGGYVDMSENLLDISGGVSSHLLSDGQTVRIAVDEELLPYPDKSWRYYVLVGSYDSLGVDGWRGIEKEAQPWLLGGEGAPILDILAPRWGSHSQKRQLERGMLHPVALGWQGDLPWLWIVLFVSLGLGTVFWIVFYIRRWTDG